MELSGGESSDRGRIHDMCFDTLLDQDGNKRANTMNHTPDIYPQNPIPLSEIELPASTESSDPSVVADNMNRSECCHRLLCQRLDICPVTDIAFDRHDIHPALVKPLFNHREAVGIDIGKDDSHAFVSESVGQCFTDTARCAGDDGNFSDQITHARLLMSEPESLR
jgi:hypothetical protein